MTERPIIFSTPMVKAVLDNKKSQTRRIMKPQPELTISGETYKANIVKLIEGGDKVCPYGQVGDSLWVRETHYRWGKWIKNGFTKTGKQAWKFHSTDKEVCYINEPPTHIFPNKTRNTVGWFKRPSIFMPRWASRINLEITGVRVERLQEITEEDCYKEGLGISVGMMLVEPHWLTRDVLRRKFKDLWDKLNLKRGYGWESSPWVWVIEFKMVTK